MEWPERIKQMFEQHEKITIDQICKKYKCNRNRVYGVMSTLKTKLNWPIESDNGTYTLLGPISNKEPKKKKISNENQKKVFDFLEKNPNGSFTEYVHTVGDPGMSDSMFYNYRRKFLGKPDYPSTDKNYSKKSRNSHPIYMTIFSKDSSAVSNESKEFLKEFIETLNSTKRTKMEVVEYLDPKRIEVREVK